MIEHSSANPKVPSSITGPVPYRGHGEASIMHHTPGVVHNFPNAVGAYDLCPQCTKISQILIKKEGVTIHGVKEGSGLSTYV